MKIIKILGDEQCYLMADGSKVPFTEFKELMNKHRQEKMESKPKKKSYRKKK